MWGEKKDATSREECRKDASFLLSFFIQGKRQVLLRSILENRGDPIERRPHAFIDLSLLMKKKYIEKQAA